MADPEDLGGGRWKVWVFLHQDRATGKQARRTRTFKADGIRRARVIAREIEAEIRAEHDRELQGRATSTLAQATERWWDLWRRRDRSPTTRQGYRSIINQHVLPSPLAARRVRDIKIGEMDRWYADLADVVSAATVRRIHAVVVQVLDQCVRDGDLAVNPASRAHKPEVRSARRAHTSVDQVRVILQAAHAQSPVKARALAFAALTGLRRGELIGLRWSRVDTVNQVAIVELNTVAVRREFIDGPVRAGGGRMVRHDKDPKAHQVAAIALGPQAAALAEAQMDWQRSEVAFAGMDLPADPVLWHIRPPFDVPLWPDTLTRWMSSARAAAGQPGVRLHDMRHYQASALLEVGATVEEVRERLRHQSLATTFGYLESDKARQRVLVSMLPQLALGLARTELEGEQR